VKAKAPIRARSRRAGRSLADFDLAAAYWKDALARSSLPLQPVEGTWLLETAVPAARRASLLLLGQVRESPTRFEAGRAAHGHAGPRGWGRPARTANRTATCSFQAPEMP
jgi:hypothetical protein